MLLLSPGPQTEVRVRCFTLKLRRRQKCQRSRDFCVRRGGLDLLLRCFFELIAPLICWGDGCHFVG